MIVVMVVVMPVIMVVPVAQQQRTHDVHQQANYRDTNRDAELHFIRLEQTDDRLSTHCQGNESQDQRRSKPTQIADLARTKTEPRVGGVSLGIRVCSGRDAERTSVCGHVEAVGE